MKKENFTAERVAGFKCMAGKQQSIYRDGKTPGLGLRVTASGTKSYIFETALHGKTIRITIGDSRTWKISDAQAEATRLKTITDQGNDPRQIKADEVSARKTKSAELKLKETRESVTFGKAWNEYLEDRRPYWGERHYSDHEKMTHEGGIPRMRRDKPTEPGALASLVNLRLVEVTTESVVEWAKREGAKRGGQARLAHRHLKAFLTWCTEHKKYKSVITDNPASHKSVRECLGKPKFKNDSLQREQLSAWFSAMRKINNPVISAYIQMLLLTGARPGELINITWKNVNFQWNQLNIGDKIDGMRTIPLTPYISRLLASLPRRNTFVFSSPTSGTGHLEDPHDRYTQACAEAGIEMEIYGLRRSFASLSEWIEMPAGIGAQIQGHKPSGVREKHYIRRPLDLLRLWHVKIENWILEQAGIKLNSIEELRKRCQNEFCVAVTEMHPHRSYIWFPPYQKSDIEQKWQVMTKWGVKRAVEAIGGELIAIYDNHRLIMTVDNSASASNSDPALDEVNLFNSLNTPYHYTAHICCEKDSYLQTPNGLKLNLLGFHNSNHSKDD